MTGEYSGKWSPTVRKAVNRAQRAPSRLSEEAEERLAEERADYLNVDERADADAAGRGYERWLDEIGGY